MEGGGNNGKGGEWSGEKSRVDERLKYGTEWYRLWVRGEGGGDFWIEKR